MTRRPVTPAKPPAERRAGTDRRRQPRRPEPPQPLWPAWAAGRP